MATKTTKKKATKKTGKAQAKQGRFSGPPEYARLAAQARPDVSLPDALKAFDDALLKVQDIRLILSHGGDEELTANRARRLADAASNLQTAGWTLRESAYHEADK